MVNKTVVDEDAAGPLTGAELFRVLQGGLSKRVDANTVAAYVASASSAAGTVTSVGMAEPAAGLKITGTNPITGAGTFTFALANDLAAVEGMTGTGFAKRLADNVWGAVSSIAPADITPQSANLFLAGPASGSAGAVAARAMVAADIPAGLVDYTRMQNVSTTNRLLGRASAGAGGIEEIACTAFARSLIAAVDAPAARSTLGVTAGGGTVTSVSITAPAAGITATGVITTSGSIAIELANDLAAVEALATTGIVRRTGASAWSAGGAINLATEVTGVLPVANFATGTPTGAKFVADDGVLRVPAGAGGGTGDVSGPSSAVDNRVVFFNGTTGKLIKDSGLTLAGSNTGDQSSISGNAGTATALQTARSIDGQAFDGTANITVIAPGTHAAPVKTTPVDADELPLVDSAASSILKRLTWANLKATLKAYFDALYAPAFSTQTANTVFAGPASGAAAPPAFRALIRADLPAAAGVVTLTDAATVAVDADGVNFPDGKSFRLVLGGNRTLANPTNLASGQVLNIRIHQDATGSRTLAYGTKYKFAGGAAPVLSTAASARDFMSCQYDATDDTLACVLNKAFG